MKWILLRLDNGSKFNISSDILRYSVGRGKDCIIRCQSLYSSRQHCDVIYEEDKIYVIDLKSANGTYINGARIPQEKATLLKVNDLIGIGVPDIIDAKSVVYKVVLESDEVPDYKPVFPADGTRKRTASDPIESLPSKISRLDVKVDVKSSVIENNFVLKEKTNASYDFISNPNSSAEHLISSTSEEDINCHRSKKCSPEFKRSPKTSPAKDIVSEVIDLAESGSEEEIELVEKKAEIIPPVNRVTEGRPSLNTSSGYTDESNVIVISDDEDDFFSSSLPISEKENDSEEEGKMDNDDIASPIEKDPLPEKAWESSDEESDNEWWPKLSQSFSEATEDGVKDEPISDEEKERDAEEEDKEAEVDEEGEENAYGDWFPVISQDFSESDDELFIKEEEDSEQECDIIDVKDEKEEPKGENDVSETIAQGSEVIMKGNCDIDASDDNFGVDENRTHYPGVVSSSTVSDCVHDLEKVRISEDDASSENRSSGQKMGKSPSSPLGVSSYGNMAEEITKTKKRTDAKESRLHLNNKKNSKGPVIVSPPTLVKGRKCIWADEEQKEPGNVVVTPPQPSSSSSSYDKEPESGVPLKNCSVILEDVMYGKNKSNLKGSKNKARNDRLDKDKKRKEIRSEALSREDKRKIQEKRKAKLQALSDKASKDESLQADAISKRIDSSNSSITSNSGNAEKISPDSRPNKVAAKVTAKNRGAFLTEFDLFAASGSDTQKKGTKSKKKVSKSRDEDPQNENTKLPLVESENQFADGSIDEHPKLGLPGITADNNHRRSRTISGTKKVPVGILKPSNADKDERKKKRSVSFKDQPEVRMFVVSPGAKMMPIKGKDYPLRMPPKYPVDAMPSTLTKCNSIVTVIYDICRWNALWLEEQRTKPASEPPPVHLDYRISPIMGTYSSYVEYNESLYPILLYEMWARIYKEWDQNFARNPLIQVLLVCVNDVRKGLSPQQELVCVNCQSVISEKDVPFSSFPKVGDLAILEFSEESEENGPTKDSNKVVSVRVFAYVDAVKRNHITPRVQISQSFGDVQPGSILFNFSLKLKKRNEKMCFSQMARLKIVCHLLSDLRTFDALLELPKSPLMPHILNPLIQDIKTIVPGHFRVKATECLNPSQKKAVAMTKMVCLSPEPRIGLVQGPPGTGKTKTIVSLIMEMFECAKKSLSQRRRDQKTPKVLLCAPSNAAIDHLVSKLLHIRTTLPKENRFRMVRVGRLEAMHPAIRDISLQELTTKEMKNIANFVNTENADLQISTIQAKVNSLMLALDSVRSRQDIAGQRNIEMKLAEYSQKLEDAKKSKNLNTASNLNSKDMKTLEISTERTVLQFADIVATTLASSANGTMLEAFPRREGMRPHFTCCIIDEACQSLEVESLIPLLLGIKNMVLFGDQQQLYPTVMSMVAKQNGLQVSLFERLWSSLTMGGVPDDVAPLVFLNVQYRMHPEICNWPNSHVYQGLINTPNDLVMERQSPFLPYVIISLEYDQNDPNQLLNGSEAELVCKLFFAMSEKTEKRSYSIGIITPYQKQKDAIETAIMKRKTTMGVQSNSLCEVNTIDSFQGQERDVVILSCVRSYKIGFLGEMKRINVALTRARRSLVVCGNFNSLKNHDLWREFLGDGLTRGIVRCVSGSHIPNQRELLNLVSRGSHE